MITQLRRNLAFVLLLSLVLLHHTPAAAQTTIAGGRGLLRVFTAEPIGRAQFFVNTNFQTFLDPSKRRDTLGKDHTLTLAFTLGLTHSLELALLTTPYQDDQKHLWGPPGDTQVGLKLALPVSFLGLSTGVRTFAIIPTAKNANVAYEPYSSGKLAAGIMGLATVDMTQSFPLVPLKMYLNFGYLDHNLKDAFLAAEEDQYVFGVGIKFPIRSLMLHTEYTGEVFANNSNVRYVENSTRLTQGVKFLGPWNLILEVAAEVGLDKPAPYTSPAPFYQKDYADWKVIFGLNYQVAFRSTSEPPATATSKREQKRVSRELEEIRMQREAAQQNLQQMEKALEQNKDEADSEPPEQE